VVTEGSILSFKPHFVTGDSENEKGMEEMEMENEYD